MQILLALLCTLALLVSCGKPSEDVGNRQVFRMNLYAGLSTLDPAYASDQSATWMCAQIFDGLLAFDSLGKSPIAAEPTLFICATMSGFTRARIWGLTVPGE